MLSRIMKLVALGLFLGLLLVLPLMAQVNDVDPNPWSPEGGPPTAPEPLSLAALAGGAAVAGAIVYRARNRRG